MRTPVKFKKNKLSKSVIFAVICSSSTLLNCMGVRNHPALEVIESKLGIQPVVEAYFDYTGPKEKWAGPASFLLHVNARNPGDAEITSTPSLEPLHLSAITVRAPSSQSEPEGKITSESMRAQLAELASAVQNGSSEFTGCLYPIRVRLVRQDGSLIEKQGCRSQAGWPGPVSRAVASYLESSLVSAHDVARQATSQDTSGGENK